MFRKPVYYSFLFLIVNLFSFYFGAYAQDAPHFSSPVGTWITISDKTHDRSGMVEIYERNGKLSGKIIKIFPGADRDPAELCVKCSGALKNKPVLGLTFLTDFVPGKEGVWEKGLILDPHNGKIYKATMELTDAGKTLKLRGYWGIFWRTQTWLRA